jgi:putative transposase
MGRPAADPADLAPGTGFRISWSGSRRRTFLQAHLGVIAAMDFFAVEVLTFGGLVRHFVLFVIDLGSRRVEIAGITRQPHAAWMKQTARNLTDGVDGFLKGTRYGIHDRDPLFTDEFRRVLRDAGVSPIKLPAQSPDLNAFAERFVLSIRSECLDKLIPLGERHLRTAVTEFVEHYHAERNHQGLGNWLIEPAAVPETPANENAPVGCRERLGGLFNFYYRRTA